MRSVSMKRAMTMIELIFVLVILGILAAFALPRLAATRDDARMSTLAQNTMTAATEIAAYAVARGETDSDFAVMSNAARLLISSNDANQTAGDPTLHIHWKGIDDCLVLKIENQGAATEILVIEANGSTSNPDCDRLRSLIDTERFPIPLRGRLISY